MGATAATELAGVEVALGVDDWSVALSTFRRNHPGAAARGTSLPATWAALRVPPERAPEEGSVHAHFRPVRGGFGLLRPCAGKP